ncbi:MAG: hypothetical protein WC410_02260 [Candidatus Paceibacterota bacterium]
MFDAPFSIYLLLPSSVFILIISFFLFAGKKSKINFIFFLIGLLQFFWTFGTYIFWKFYSFGYSTTPLYGKVFSLAVFLIPVFLYHFSIEFCKVQTQKVHLFVAYVVSFLFVAIVDAQQIINGLFFYKWGNFDGSEVVFYLYCAFVFLLLLMTLYNFLRALLSKEKSTEMKKDKIILFLLAFAIFGLVFIEFLPVQGINIYPLFYLTIPVYALIIAYIMIERNPLALIVTTDILVAVILTFLASFVIFREIEIGIFERSLIFILISVACFLLLKYTYQLKNQKQKFKEELEERTRELKDRALELIQAKEELEKVNWALEIKIRERTRELQEANLGLEEQVAERTKELKRKAEELEEKIKELRDFSNIFVNRENKMVELKSKISELEEKVKRKK